MESPAAKPPLNGWGGIVKGERQSPERFFGGDGI